MHTSSFALLFICLPAVAVHGEEPPFNQKPAVQYDKTLGDNYETSKFVLPYSGVLALLRCGAGKSPTSTASASDIPHLQKQGTATQLIVNGKPFLALAGELGNNTATSLEYMEHVWPKLVATKLNCVLAAVSWAQIEPEEGKFDFHVLDGVIEGARSHDMRLVLLWFGSWKNGQSSYPPDWVKRDFERFPRAQVRASGGTQSIEVLSPFSWRTATPTPAPLRPSCGTSRPWTASGTR